MPSLQLKLTDNHTRYNSLTHNFFNYAVRCSGTLDRYRVDHLSGMNAGRSLVHCAVSFETGSGRTSIASKYRRREICRDYDIILVVILIVISIGRI